MSSRADRRLLGLVIAAAVALRAYPWTQPHTLLGVMEVDDGVYYGAAKMLLHGLVPYRDFVIVHPPLTSVLLLPFAALGSAYGDPAGLASARVALLVVGIANVLLVHRLALRLPVARPREVALAAAALYAVMPDAVVAEHTVLLEPLVNLFCLLAVLCLLRRATRRWALIAGVLLVAGCGVKLFAGVYVLGVLAWLLVSRRRDQLLGVVAGLVLGTAVLILPFFVLAPSALLRDVVVTQLSRPADNTAGGLVYLLDQLLPHLLSLLVLLALLAAVIQAGRVVERRHPGSPDSLWVIVAGLGLVAFATSASYFPHYTAFLVPPFGLLLAQVVARGGTGRLAMALLVAGFTVASVLDDGGYVGQRDLRQAGAKVPAGSCVFYEAISKAIAADVLALPSKTCPSWVDGRGVALTQSTDWPKGEDFYPAGFLADRQWQRDNLMQVQHADFLLIDKGPRAIKEWTPEVQEYAATHFRQVWSEHNGKVGAELWKRLPD